VVALRIPLAVLSSLSLESLPTAAVVDVVPYATLSVTEPVEPPPLIPVPATTLVIVPPDPVTGPPSVQTFEVFL
jgi:hypothetical protein